MGIKQIVTDDLTGKQFEDAVDPTPVTFDGKTYDVYLSNESVETLAAMFSGEAPVMAAIDDANRAKDAIKGQLDALTLSYNALKEHVDVLVSTYTGDNEAPEAVQDFIKGVKAAKTSTVPTSPNASTKKAASGTRVRLTGDKKAKFDKDTEAFKTAKAEQRVKIFEYAATTDKHAEAKDGGKNIAAGLVEDFYAKYPDAVRYYGPDKVEAPVNADYA